MCALAKGNLIPGASSRLEAESPNDAGRYDGRGEDRGSPAELLRATRLSRLARPVSDNVTSLLFYTRYRGTPPFILPGYCCKPWHRSSGDMAGNERHACTNFSLGTPIDLVLVALA